ncbi:ubiquitin 8 [Tanacetum coccineum]|uniref:Ubiquitin 8 n=1 Tax=Tanacetum coccineum TaxID=301880 RepID=A0ABQ4ZXK2_9ASTR
MTEKINLLVTVFRDGQLNRCSLKVKKTDTIKDVRYMIESEEGIDTGTLYLIAVNPKVELEDTQTLEELQIYDGFNLFLAEVKTPSSLVEYGLIKIFYKMVYTGDTQSLLVERSDSIETLKLMIQEKSHIPEDMQRLSTSYRRQLIEKHMSLDDYGISCGDTLLLDIGGPIRVNVFLIHSQRNIHVDVEILDTVDAVKSKIQDMEGIPASKQWLKGSATDIDLKGDRTLADCEVGNEGTLYLQIAPMRININFYPTNEIICLKVDETETIDNVKAKIHLKIGVSSEKLWVSNVTQILSVERSFKGDRTLAECNICNGDTLICDFEMCVSFKIPYVWILSAGLVQISVTTLTGESIILEVNQSDTISNVRSLVESKKGFLLHQHVLFCEGKQLEDNLVLSKIPNRSTLYCLPKPRARLQILVKLLNGKTIVLKVKSTKTVGSLLRKIYDMEDIPSNRQHRLLLAGQELNNNNTILECSIRWNSLLLLVPGIEEC